MCLEEVASGDAQGYLRVFENAIEDLAEVSALPNTEAKAKLIASFKSFMNDQCSVNGVLTKAIEQLRKDVLPSVLNYSCMTEKEIESAERMGHFACRMHLLANFATAADKGIKSYEDAVSHGTNPHAFVSEESGSLRLIQTCAKALTKRGSDKSGVNAFFESFLETKHRQNNIVTFRGHRFNIMFVDAAAIYFHKEDIVDFLSLMPDPNRLLKSVAWDVKEKVYIAGVRALGLLSKFVMEPFYHLLLGNLSILQLNLYLDQLHKTLEAWSNDGSQIWKATAIFGEQYLPVSDKVREELLKDTGDCDLDALTQVAVELVCGELLILLERQAHSQLAGGELMDLDHIQKRAASNVPAHNLLSERDMACYDNLLKVKPGASMATIEATVMWSNNKTDEWLAGKSEKEREEIMKRARERRGAYALKVKGRLEWLKKQKLERLRQKQEKKALKEDSVVSARLKAIRDVREFGGMWEESEIDERINSLEEEDVKRAVLGQIKYQKLVVGATGQRQLFQASENGQQYDIARLLTNLRQILNTAVVGVQTESSLQCVEDFQAAAEDKKRAIFKSLVESRKRRQNIRQVSTLLPLFTNDPSALVGRSVLHKCVEEGEVEWFGGTVKGVYKLNKSALKTDFEIVYDSTPEDSWHFPLLIDLKNGDLVVV